MKLLNTRTIQLEDFVDGNIPSYAILSHRWQKEELNFRDLKPKFAESLPSKPGYAKIYHFCTTALWAGFGYGWVDTICIDKRSSAELSEAINSMFRWYQDAVTCYVYMNTVPSSKIPGELDQEQLHAFRGSDWFLRGWTLQELLAPEHVVFLDCNWIKFGTKVSLAPEISLITNIEERFLIDSSRLTLGGHVADPPCVATKMSWASMRTTSRKEDMAYCLLGLFDINMPLLYGEGEKAFARLQEEIIRKTDDETIFAWRSSETLYAWGGGRNFLAPSPKSFVNSQDYRILDSADGFGRPPYSITNRGLEFQCELIQSRSVELFWEHQDRNFRTATLLLPLRVYSVKAGRQVACALAVVEDGEYSIFKGGNDQRQTKRLRRADPGAIYQCTWEEEGPAPSITTITRAPISLVPWGDRPQDVTNDYCRPTASDRSTQLARQLHYLSLNEPLYRRRHVQGVVAQPTLGRSLRIVTRGYGIRSSISPACSNEQQHRQRDTFEPV